MTPKSADLPQPSQTRIAPSRSALLCIQYFQRLMAWSTILPPSLLSKTVEVRATALSGPHGWRISGAGGRTPLTPDNGIEILPDLSDGESGA
jgi:hypothetical protein